MTHRTLRTPAVTLLLTVVMAALWLMTNVRTALAAGVVGDGTPGSCTDTALQAAIASGPGTISFSCGANPVTILMTTKVIPAGQNYTIVGGGKVTLDGQETLQLFIVDGSLVLRDLALAHGAGFDGSVIRINAGGGVNIFDSTISDSGTDADRGGAIYNSGSLLLQRTLLINNESDLQGGAVYNGTGASLAVYGSTFLGNRVKDPVAGLGDGAGIYNLGTLNVFESTFFANRAKRSGGAIYTATGSATIVNATLAENSADYDAAGDPVVNTGGQGGGIFAGASAGTSLRNVTIERNNADIAGGIWNGGNVRMGNTIVANSSVSADNGTPSLNCDGGSVISDGHNLIGDNSCVTGGDASDLRSVNPMLSFINPNGGPTDTLLPLIGSPAIDAGDNALCPAQDQRGVVRPVGSACDIGAVEWRLIDTGGSFLPIVQK